MNPKNPYVVSRCIEVDNVIAAAVNWSSNDDKLAAHLAAYISVLVVGVFEDCIENLVAARASKANDTELERYVIRIVAKHFKNPDYQKIVDMLGDFSMTYKQTFKSKIAADGHEAVALQSLVDNKNSLAHVGTSKLNMTLTDVTIYYQQAVPILQTLEQILA